MSTATQHDLFMCESGGVTEWPTINACGHTIPTDTYNALDQYRGSEDAFYIVRSECAEGFKVIQRYGNYCLIEDKRS